MVAKAPVLAGAVLGLIVLVGAAVASAEAKPGLMQKAPVGAQETPEEAQPGGLQKAPGGPPEIQETPQPVRARETPVALPQARPERQPLTTPQAPSATGRTPKLREKEPETTAPGKPVGTPLRRQTDEAPNPSAQPGSSVRESIERKKKPAPAKGITYDVRPPYDPEGSQPEQPSTESQLLENLGRGVVEKSDVSLMVNRLGGDLEGWGDSWADHPPVPVDFRWQSSIDGAYKARWELSRTIDFASVLQSRILAPIPPKGQYGRFTIDFREVEGAHDMPATYFVRVFAHREGVPEAEQPSPSRGVRVSITDTMAGQMTEFKMPVITGLMPFSSCNPGGGIIMGGHDFGEQPGRLYLVGEFPNDQTQLDLESVRWTPTSVSGTVPPITGVGDQEVSIQVVTSEGRKSDPVLCQFTATREVLYLPKAGGFRQARCHVGSNYKSGEGDKCMDVGGRYSFICYHLTDHSIWFEGNDGTDYFETQRLINGWTFHHMRFGDHSDDGGRILSVNGFQEGAKKLVIEIPWESDRQGVVHYYFDLRIIGPAGVKFLPYVEYPES